MSTPRDWELPEDEKKPECEAENHEVDQQWSRHS